MPKEKLNLEKLVSKTKIYLVIIFVILLILCIIEPRAIIPSIITFSLVIAYTIWANNKRQAEITKHINEITINVDKAAQSTIINSPFPLVILDTTGKIIWKSSKFAKEFANIDIGNNLNDIVKEIKIKIEESEKTNNDIIYENANIGDKQYKIIGEYTKVRNKDHKNSQEYMVTVYFLDETEYQELLEKYNDSQICMGIIVIDNYEEMMQRITEEEKLAITSEIEKNIYAWTAKYNGIAIKSERDTYVCILEQQFVEQIKQDKFTILDEIKNIKTHDKIQATLSIAISEDGELNSEKYKSAKAVIDIALGRGGDQAIIKQNGKYYFFGGRTQEIEKRTKVKARIVAQAIEELMNGASNIIIMGHTNSDIDAMGSALGVYRIAKTLEKQAFILCNSTGTSLDSFLEDINQIDEYKEVLIKKETALDLITQDTLLVVVDTDKKNYVDAPELLDKTDKIAIIDHHRRGTDYIENAILTFHEVYASSAAELVVEILQYSENEIEL